MIVENCRKIDGSSMQPTRTEAVKRFLTAKTHEDLAILYNKSMEVQVNVAQDGGERVTKDFKGRKWQGYTDGVQTWKAFRIPYKANSDPEYTDVKMSFDLSAHVEGIGMTGWDWEARVSRWVAYDFDALIGHSEKHLAKLTNEELNAVRQAAMEIPWVTVRKSTSGKGLHLYVFLDSIPTSNHTEHAALARAILGKMTALTGFDFHSKVDICGRNMWVWHRKMRGTDGLTKLKDGTILKDVPPNWRDHIQVVSRKRRKNLPKKIGEVNRGDSFDELTGQRPKIKLDEEHQRLIDYLEEVNAFWWWDQDHHMLVTHTYWLAQAHETLSLKGYFQTDSKGTNPNEQNCFGFPIRRGAWAIRRYTPGVQEHASWSQDGAGWTRCYLNREPDLATACRALGGIEDTDGSFEFTDAESGIQGSQLLGVHINLDTPMRHRRTILKQHKDGRLIVRVKHEKEDRGDKMGGWAVKKGWWQRIFHVRNEQPDEPDLSNHDDLVRKLVVHGVTREDAGWMLRSDGAWSREPMSHVKIALKSLGHPAREVETIMGTAIFRAWKIVNKPFQPEYPGDREWNRNAAQLRYVPTRDAENLTYPTWSKILAHCGSGLDDAIKQHPWCRANGILHGADYLKIWVASLFQDPYAPLPYLFFYGPEDCGKSSFHQSLQLLLTKGYVRGDQALTNDQGFNGELDGALICVVEETDLRKDKRANRRIKDWVLTPDFQVIYKGKTPFMSTNTMHWIQCDNDHQACPVFPGDTRITMCYVQELDPLEMIPRKRLVPLLQKEAPDFLAEILNLEIPESNSRLNVPIVTTHEKQSVQKLNQNSLEMFIDEMCESSPGQMIKVGDFYTRFVEWLDPSEMDKWSKIRVGRSLPPQYPKGRRRQDGQFYIGNLWWKGQARLSDETRRLILVDNKFLDPADD